MTAFLCSFHGQIKLSPKIFRKPKFFDITNIFITIYMKLILNITTIKPQKQ